MKEKINYSLNQRIPYSYREPLFQKTSNRKCSSIDNEEQVLFSHKSSLETLLNIIKDFQLEYLSKNFNKSKNNKISTKQMITSLKDSLNIMLNEKNKKLDYIQNKNEMTKKNVQSKLFPYIEEMKINKYNLSLENKNYFISEKNQLELLNFQIKNEIEKTNFLIQQKTQINTYIKSLPFFFEANQEIACSNNHENNKKISQFLKEIIRRVRKDFINVVRQKMKKELEINGMSIQINYIKDSIEDYKLNGCKKYIETEDIIEEQSNEYSKSIITNQSKRNSLSNINKKIIKKMSISSGGSKKYKISKKEGKITKRNKLFENKLNKDLLGEIDNNKNVNNYLNMNINVNINLNNNKYLEESFNSSLDSHDNNEKNTQYEMDLNQNNKIIITPIITNESKNESNSNNSDNDDSFTLDIEDK